MLCINSNLPLILLEKHQNFPISVKRKAWEREMSQGAFLQTVIDILSKEKDKDKDKEDRAVDAVCNMIGQSETLLHIFAKHCCSRASRGDFDWGTFSEKP